MDLERKEEEGRGRMTILCVVEAMGEEDLYQNVSQWDS